MRKTSVWPWILSIVVVICVAVIVVVGIVCHNPFVFRIEMDNNTRAAMESINYSALNTERYNGGRPMQDSVPE